MRHKLPPPRLGIQAGSMLSALVTLMSSDALAMSLRQYDEFALTRSELCQLVVLLPVGGQSLKSARAFSRNSAVASHCMLYSRPGPPRQGGMT